MRVFALRLGGRRESVPRLPGEPVRHGTHVDLHPGPTRCRPQGQGQGRAHHTGQSREHIVIDPVFRSPGN